MLCLSLGKANFKECMNAVIGKDIIELRLDLIEFSDEELKKFFLLSIPIICSFAKNDKPDKYRAERLKYVSCFGAKYIDIELNLEREYKIDLLNFAKANKIKTIISYHNYETTPSKSELKKIYSACSEYNPDIIKIVCKANNDSDIETIMSLYHYYDKMIAFSIGEFGKDTRIKALKLGAPFMFAGLNKESATAIGQYTYEEMEEMIRNG